MESFFICPRCGASEPRHTGFLNGKPYCRRCISFSGQEIQQEGDINPIQADLDIDYQLSKEQKEISSLIVDHYKNKEDVLIRAVTGAGKTELVFELIQYVLSLGGKVGFAIPRRDVVMELALRFQKVFPTLKVVSVYGGHHEVIEGDLVILTTHQIYRYQSYFDALIIDEIDAFPFKGNEVLSSLAFRSVKGRIVMMSATPEEKIINQFRQKGKAILELWTRYHGYELPLPRIEKRFWIFRYDCLYDYLKKFKKNKKPVLVFVPTIAMAEKVFLIVNLFFKGGNIVHSKKIDRSEVIEGFRKGKFWYLVTTAVLERGVTIKDLQVIIFGSEHNLYDSSTLVQISGRVGRKATAPDGEVIFICEKVNSSMLQAIKDIRLANSHLPLVL